MTGVQQMSVAPHGHAEANEDGVAVGRQLQAGREGYAKRVQCQQRRAAEREGRARRRRREEQREPRAGEGAGFAFRLCAFCPRHIIAMHAMSPDSQADRRRRHSRGRISNLATFQSKLKKNLQNQNKLNGKR